jgi:hypothetical protein
MRYRRAGFACSIVMTVVLPLVLLLATAPSTIRTAHAADTDTAQPAPVQVMSLEEQADQKAIARELAPNAPHRLDIGNPLHYRLIRQILARAGETPQKSPEFFRRIELAHTERMAELARTNAAPQPAQPVLTGNPPSEPADLNFIATFSRNGPGFQATGLSSILDGSIVTSIVMELYDDNTGTVYAHTGKEQYAQGENFAVQVTGTPGELKNPTSKAQGLFSYIPSTEPDSKPIFVIQQNTDTVNPTDGCMLQPNYCVRNELNQCVTGQYQTACTNKVTNTTPIKLCWYRFNQQECDYWNATAHPTNFVFPLSGNVQFPVTVVTPAAGIVYIALQNPLKGGGCNVYFQQGQTLNPANWTVTDKSIAWNFPASAFPNTGACINYYDGVMITLWMTAYVGLQGSGGPPPFGTINFTSDRSQLGVPGVYIIPALNIWQGCFAAGTEITLNDGQTTRAVEDFLGDGHETVATGAGVARLIGGTTVGTEPDKDMVQLATDNGHSLLVTEGHPIILADGTPVLAKDLKVGDSVRTLQGPAALVTLTRARYSGKVYNLIVGLGDDQHDGTVYANGILAGDAHLQNEFVRMAAETQRKDPSLARARLSSEWLTDFDNHTQN